MKEYAIVVDIDDTVLDWRTRFLEFAKPYTDSTDLHDDGMMPIIGAFNRSDEFYTLDAIDDAFEALHCLHAEGINIIFLSSCVPVGMRVDDVLERRVQNMIGAEGSNDPLVAKPNVEMHLLHLGETKASMITQIKKRFTVLAFIDDTFKHVRRSATMVTTPIVFHRPHHTDKDFTFEDLKRSPSNLRCIGLWSCIPEVILESAIADIPIMCHDLYGPDDDEPLMDTDPDDVISLEIDSVDSSIDDDGNGFVTVVGGDQVYGHISAMYTSVDDVIELLLNRQSGDQNYMVWALTLMEEWDECRELCEWDDGITCCNHETTAQLAKLYEELDCKLGSLTSDELDSDSLDLTPIHEFLSGWTRWAASFDKQPLGVLVNVEKFMVPVINYQWDPLDAIRIY